MENGKIIKNKEKGVYLLIILFIKGNFFRISFIAKAVYNKMEIKKLFIKEVFRMVTSKDLGNS